MGAACSAHGWDKRMQIAIGEYWIKGAIKEM
jgi:hypothetical protein